MKRFGDFGDERKKSAVRINFGFRLSPNPSFRPFRPFSSFIIHHFLPTL